MHILHTVTLTVHILAGTIALLIGVVALFAPKRRGVHTRYGRYFLGLLSVVVGTAFVGLVLFRTSSFLLMLTLLAGYVGYAGYRTSQLREQRSTTADAVLAILALMAGAGVLYLVWLEQSGGNWAPTVIYSTLAALALVTTYDLIKHVWLHERLKTWWLYEHIYKMVSAYSAILSAFTGTVLPNWKPYSQIGPSVICVWCIAYFIWRQARTRPSVAGKPEQLATH